MKTATRIIKIITLGAFLVSLFLGCEKKYKPTDVAARARKLYFFEISNKKDIENLNKTFGRNIDPGDVIVAYDVDWGTAMTEFNRGVLENEVRNNPEKALEHFKKAFNEINYYNENYPKLKAIKEGLTAPLYCYGFARTSENPDSVLFYLNKAKKSFEKIGYKDGLADCLEYLGDFYLKSDLDTFKARINYQKALKNISKKNFLKRADMLDKIAETFNNVSDSCVNYKHMATKLRAKSKCWNKCKTK